MSAVSDSLPLPEIYYQSSARVYWREDMRGNWMQVDKDTARKFVMRAGRNGSPAYKGGLSPADGCLLDIQEQQNVAYAAPLAGHNAGFYCMNGQRILVTDSPRLITPAQGDWCTIRRIIDGMFLEEGHDQRPYLFGWLHIALTNFHSGSWSPGQILAMAGPISSGKSLLQQLFTEMFGGRSAYPYQFMVNDTDFNADLFRAEHLIIDDQVESHDYRSRRNFGANLKQVAVTYQHRCHAKQQTPLTLEPHWRMTISLNDEPERLMVLPPLDGDVADKIMLLRVNYQEMPMPTETQEQQEQFRAALRSELPAFVYDMLHYQIPQDLRSPRFGIATFHHPDLVELINETKPEVRLMELIDRVVFCGRDEAWSGTSTQLLAELHEDQRFGNQARDLVKNANICGTYLSRLVGDGGRVCYEKRHNTNHYTIQPQQGGTGEHFPNLISRDVNIIVGDTPLLVAGSKSVPPSPQIPTCPTRPRPPGDCEKSLAV